MAIMYCVNQRDVSVFDVHGANVDSVAGGKGFFGWGPRRQAAIWKTQ
jgi:hypothetical protein